MTDSFQKVTGHIISLFVVSVLGRILKYIPGVQEACNKEVCRDPRFFEFLPNHFKTQDMRNEAVRNNPWALSHVPDQYKTQEMCK